MGTFDRLSDKKIIENELKVIQSKTLLYDVVKRQHLYAEFFEKGEYKSLPAYVTSPVRIEAQDPDALKSAKEVLFTYNEKDSTVQIGPKKFELNKFEETEWGTIRFVLNHKYAYKAQKPLYFTLQKARNAADGLGMVKAIIGRETTVIEMTYTNADPTRGEDILNELIRSYDRANVDEKNRLAINTEAYVRERLDSVQREIDAINGKKTTYKSSRGAQDLSEKGALFLKTVTENDQRVGDVNIQLSVLNQVEKYVKSKDNAGGIVPSTLGVKDPMLGKLVEDLYDTEINYDKVKKTSGENNPITLSIKDKMDKMRPGILENINNQRNNLEATKSNLNITSNTYNSMLSSIPQQERDLIDIDRELTIKLGIYNFLRQRLEESALAHSNIDTGARIVDPAQSTPFPVSPNGKMIYIVAFIFGLGLPAGFIAVKEMLNRKVMFRAEIEKLTSVPIIGEVIHDKGKTPLVILEGKRTFIAEQFRRIRTSLTFLGINSQKKKILITSSLSGEGKSFVATNLALSLALAGKKVVLVEFDLANPSLSKKLNVNYEKGASTYLWGEAEPEEIIKRTAVNENLFFIPSGPLPDNPSELLMSDRVRELIEYLEAIFDTIIIDSAPANLLSDAYVLSPMCDATLFVVKHKYTPKMNLERLDEEDGVNQLKNLGIIFNGIRSRGFTKNGYGYGYGYGYIQNNEKKKKKKKEYYKDE
jgi:capsular exopolysaccharide synthesis family protein